MGKPHRRDRALLALAIVAALSEWTAAAAQGVDVGPFKDQVVALINQQRGIVGLPPLQRVGPLDAAAQAYSESMMHATAGGPVYLSHTGPDGSSLASRVSATGYNWYTLGEDLAAGQTTPDQAVAQWMSSPEHRANILNPDFGDAGVGIAIGPGTWSDGRQDPQVIWWTVDFGQGVGGPDPSSPAPPSPAVSGYSTLDGTPVNAAPFGSLVQISGQNLGITGTIAFHGRATSAISWSATSILAIVPLQFSYPDTGPVTVTLADRVVTGPSFTTQQPGIPAPLPAPPPNPFAGTLPGAWPPSWSFGSSSAPATPLPFIRELVDSSNRVLLTARQGQLFLIHGSGFGTNLLRQSRVLFVTPFGSQIGAGIWDWSDSSITAFAPFVSGPAQVVVEVNASGTPVSSNRVGLTVQ